MGPIQLEDLSPTLPRAWDPGRDPLTSSPGLPENLVPGSIVWLLWPLPALDFGEFCVRFWRLSHAFGDWP